MTVSSTIAKSGPYTANGVTTIFNRDFLILSAAHIRVVQTIDGISTDITSGFSQTGIGSPTGSVVFSVAPTSGTITILRNVPREQQSDYSSQASVDPAIIESDLDLLVMQMQDLAVLVQDVFGVSVREFLESLSQSTLAALVEAAAAGLAWRQTDVIDMSDAPWINVSPSAVAQPKNHVFIRQDTSVRTDATSVQMQRVVTTDDGHTNPKALRVYTQITAGGGDQIEWAISGEIDNSDSSRTGAEGGTAVSGVARKQAANTGAMFGGHFQVKDETGSATSGGIVGVEINIQANGADTNSNRIGLDLIAKTYLSGTAGEFLAGLRVRNNAMVDGGKWTNGILIQDGVQTILNGITIENSPGTGVGHGLSDSGSKAVGLQMDGTYGAAAIRIASGQAIAIDGTANIKTSYASNIWGFFNSTNERVGFDMTATPRVRVGGTAVLGARKTGWATATGTATRTTFDTTTITTAQLAERVKALIDDLHSTAGHGLIGT